MTVSSLFLLLPLVLPAVAQTPPADTYFSLAVADDSHNHSGAALLFLDFQEPPYDAPDPRLGLLVATRAAAGSITLDGSAAEWDPARFLDVRGLVQNDYPLSEFLDAVRTPIRIASAWDDQNVYFVVQWEDAGHDESRRIAKWIFGDQGGGERGWNPQRQRGAVPGTPGAAAANRGQPRLGVESEDRLFLMFPLVDAERNFRATGLGCALYCHGNLRYDDPAQHYTGLDVAVMHANLPGDRADVWHWKAARTAPSGVADDEMLVDGRGLDDGLVADAGSAAYQDNALLGPDPAWMHFSGLGFLGDVLYRSDAVPFQGNPAAGEELPRFLSVPPSGSRGDVAAASHFDSASGWWTVELRRLRDTGHADDHSFTGPDAAPPRRELVRVVDPRLGRIRYQSNCMSCHGPEGRGVVSGGAWTYPRVQRASGSQIRAAIATFPEMAPLASRMDPQGIEDIAAYLQGLATYAPILSVTGLMAGTTATLDLRDAEPGAQLFFGWSVAGRGPSFLPGWDLWVDLAAPIHLAGTASADAAGSASLSLPIPAGAAGVHLWLQALALGGGKAIPSNPVDRVVR